MSLLSFKKKPTLSFVFDIRDSSLSLAAVKFEKGEKPEFIFCQNFPIQIRDTKDHQKYIASMLTTLDEAILSVRKSLIKIGNTERIGKHFFFIGSPWSITQAKSIKVTKDRPFEINNAFLEKIITNEKVETEKQFKQNFVKNDWCLLEQRIIQSKVNGHNLENVFGKWTRNFKAELLISFIPLEIRNKIYSVTEEKLGKHHEKSANSSALALWDFLKNTSGKNHFLCADIGDFLTDVYVVRDGVISATVSFPIGEQIIRESIVKKLKISDHLVASAAKIHLDSNYDTTSQEGFETHLASAKDLWTRALTESLAKVCTISDIPKILFVIAQNELFRTMIEKIKTQDDQPLSILGTEMEIRPLDEQLLNNQITNAKTFANEPYIKIDLILLNKTL